MRNQQAFVANRDALLGAAAAAYVVAKAVQAPIQASIDFSSKLEDIRQMAGLTQKEIEGYGDSWRQVGLDTAQGASAITDAVKALAASGAVTTDEASQIAGPIGKTATAYRADPAEVAQAAGAVMNTMHVSAGEIGKVFDIMAVGANNGSVELKNMAGGFGTLAASASTFGVKGTAAVADLVTMLEIAATTSGTPDKAMTNMNAFLASVQSPDVRKKFAAVGVDVVKEMNAAIDNGVSPFEHILGIIDKKTQGGKRDLLGDLFGREEAVNFIIPLLANMEKYRADRAEAMTANGQVEADFAARMQTPGAIMARFYASLEELQLTIGDDLVPELTKVVQALIPVTDSVSSFVKANGQLTTAVVEITAALIGLRLLTSAGGLLASIFGIATTAAPVAATAVTAGSVAGEVAGVGGILAGGTKFLSTTFGKLTGGLLIYELAKLANSMGVGENMVDPNKPWHQNVVHGLDPTLEKMIYEGYNPLPAMGTKVNGVADRSITGGQDSAQMAEIRQMLADNANGSIPLHPIELTALKEQLAGLEADAAAAGTAAGTSLNTNFVAELQGLVGQMGAIMVRLQATAASGVSIPTRLTGPGLPGPAQSAIDGARAGGGPVRRGGTYLVGENGPELASFGAAGWIHPAGSFSPMAMPSRGGGAQQVGGDQHFTFGDIILSNPTNANPQQIARELGRIVSDRLRSSHSNGAM